MLTPTYLRRRYWFSQAVLLGAFLYLLAGFVAAQSQDYINATNATEIANLKRQVDSIDSRMWLVLVGVASSLLAQAVNIRNNWRVKRDG